MTSAPSPSAGPTAAPTVARRRLSFAYLTALVAFQAAVNYAFTASMGARMYGDEVNHTQTILNAALHGLGSLWSGMYTPLFDLVAVALHGVFGLSVEVAVAANIPFHAALVFGTFGLARRSARSETAGLLAATLVTLLPMTTGLSRMVMLDYASAGMTALCLYRLLETDGFRDRVRSLIFGVVAGLGVLTRDNVPIFMAGPVAVLFLDILRDTRPSQRNARLKHLAWAGLLAVAIAATWYGYHLEQKVGGGAMRVTMEGNHADTPLWSWDAWMFYPFAVSDIVLGPWLFAPFLAALPLFFARVREDRASYAAFLLIPWFVFTPLPWKLARYMAPWSSVMAVMIVVAAFSFEKRAVRAGILAVVFAAATWTWLGTVTRRVPAEWVHQNEAWASVLHVRWTHMDYQQDAWFGPPIIDTTQIEPMGRAIASVAPRLGREVRVARILNTPDEGRAGTVAHPFAFPINIELMRARIDFDVQDLQFGENGLLKNYWGPDPVHTPAAVMTQADFVIIPANQGLEAEIESYGPWRHVDEFAHLNFRFTLMARPNRPELPHENQ